MGVKGLKIEAAECAVKLEAWGQGTKKKEERRKVKEAGGTESQGNVNLVQNVLKTLNCQIEQMMWTTSMQRSMVSPAEFSRLESLHNFHPFHVLSSLVSNQPTFVLFVQPLLIS